MKEGEDDKLTWTFEIPSAEVELQGLAVICQVLDDRVREECWVRIVRYLKDRYVDHPRREG